MSSKGRPTAGRYVKRPIVRSFEQRFVARAAAHVRAGGHAIVWESPSRARLVVPAPDEEDPTDLGLWSIYDLGMWRYTIATQGPLAGLAFIRVPPSLLEIVRQRAERDSVFPGPSRRMKLDCLACGACCRDNRVELEKSDIRRWVEAGRGELLRRPWSRRADGKIVLVLRRDKRCKHLMRDNRCAIYAVRPEACSTCPMGSEGCLF